MVVRTRKGKYYQQKAKKFLESCGYKDIWLQKNFVRKIFVGGRWIWISKGNDIFGCDIIAMKKDRLIFVQVSYDSNILRRLEELNKYDFVESEEVKIYLFQYRDRNRLIIREYKPKEKIFCPPIDKQNLIL